MNHTIIPFSKKKMVKLTGIYILIMLGIAAIIVFIGIMDKNVAFFGYIASNGQKCCSFLDRYLDNTKNYLTFALSV